MFFVLPTSDVCPYKYVLDITFAVRMQFILFAPYLLYTLALQCWRGGKFRIITIISLKLNRRMIFCFVNV